jgi:hypothetical protein
MYFHVIENTQRNRVKGYRLVKTYKSYKALQKWVEKEGKVVWVVASKYDHLRVNGQHSQPSFGNIIADYWNSGGWGTTTMPLMPLFNK